MYVMSYFPEGESSIDVMFQNVITTDVGHS